MYALPSLFFLDVFHTVASSLSIRLRFLFSRLVRFTRHLPDSLRPCLSRLVAFFSSPLSPFPDIAARVPLAAVAPYHSSSHIRSLRGDFILTVFLRAKLTGSWAPSVVTGSVERPTGSISSFRSSALLICPATRLGRRSLDVKSILISRTNGRAKSSLASVRSLARGIRLSVSAAFDLEVQR